MASIARDDGSPEGVARRTSVEPGTVPVGKGRLWLGLVLAPATWLGAELIGYYLAARSCELAPGGVPFAGTAYPRATHLIVQSIAVIIIAVGVAVAAGNWRATSGDVRPGDAPAPGRAQFMSFCGVFVGLLSLFGVLLFDVSGLFVNVCSQAR